MDVYQNPDCVPLEELELYVKTSDGVVVVKNALSPHWAEKRYFLHYEVPQIYDKDGSEIEGAKNHWMETIQYIIEDLKWLLSLQFYQFWSNVVYNTSIVDTLVSFLQEAPPFYALESFPTVGEMRENLEELRHAVLMIFSRLVTNKESPTEYMSNPFLGNLLYDNYIFTVPIIFDLCQLYGRENAKVMQRILRCLFDLQPMYNDDLQKSVPCLISALENVERRFDNSPTSVTEATALSERRNSIDMTLYNLEELILYILDVSSTLTILLRTYPSVTLIFHIENFMNKIVSLYGSTIPQMYQKLDKLALNDENMPKYMELKHRLDVTRIEILELYRIIIYEPVSNIREGKNTTPASELRTCVDEYLNILINAISEKEFIMDYHRLYPIKSDLEILSKLCPELDAIKHNYILQGLNASIGDTAASVNEYSNNIDVGGSNGIQNGHKQTVKQSNSVKCTKNEKRPKDTDEMSSLVAELKEILCDYDEGFLQACLKHYKNNTASVVQAVFDNELPATLEQLLLNTKIPHVPLDPEEVSAAVDLAVRDFERLEMFNNNESNLTQYADTSMSRTEKKRYRYNSAREMLNDKSEINRNFYSKYGIVSDYDDEYDDTYDSHNIRGAQDDSTEADSRPFTTPRVFRSHNKASSEDDDENDNEKPARNSNHFVENPADMRAKAEQRRLAKDGRNAHGKPRDGDQDGSANKFRKNKSRQTNHSRRAGAQMKKRQGMIPS